MMTDIHFQKYILHFRSLILVVLLSQVALISAEEHVGNDDYMDVSAMKCPSSWDEVAKQFRSENYWIFQKNSGEENVSMVLRPNRETGTWRRDVDTVNRPMTVTPESYNWESLIYTGINTLDRNAMTLDRNRDKIDDRSATSQCQALSPEAAREAVETRYQQQLEGND